MRIKEGYVLREVAGQAVVIAVGEASRAFHGMINLNSTGRDIWLGVQQGLEPEEIARRLTEEYDVALEEARQDTEEMLERMKAAGVLEA